MSKRYAARYSFPNGSAPSSTHSTTVKADSVAEVRAILEKRHRSKNGIKFESIKPQ